MTHDVINQTSTVAVACSCPLTLNVSCTIRPILAHAPSAVANTTNETRNNFLFILKIALNYDATESQSATMPIKIVLSITQERNRLFCQLHRNAIWRNEIKLCKTRTPKIKPHQDADVRKTDCRDDGTSKKKLNLDANPEINSNS